MKLGGNLPPNETVCAPTGSGPINAQKPSDTDRVRLAGMPKALFRVATIWKAGEATRKDCWSCRTGSLSIVKDNCALDRRLDGTDVLVPFQVAADAPLGTYPIHLRARGTLAGAAIWDLTDLPGERITARQTART